MSSGRKASQAPAVAQTWYRCSFALAVVIADGLLAALFLGYDILGVYATQDALSCASLGVDSRLCRFLQGNGVPYSVFFSTASIAAIFALGLYDPRPLLYRIEQSTRSRWWLSINAAGVAVFVSPYLLVAAGVPLSDVAPRTPLLLLTGAAMAASGLLFWLSDIRQLGGVVKLHHVGVLIAIFLIPFATLEIQTLAWKASFLQTATIHTTAFLLELVGQQVVTEPGAIIGIGEFKVVIDNQCSGIEGIALVIAVAGGYLVTLRNRLWIKRALLIIPLAVTLSWLLNGVRIASLLMIGARGFPDLALNGFHSYAGWLIFCILSTLILFAADNVAWIHREAGPKSAAFPVLTDPLAAQVVPFVVLLVSSLLTSAFFIEPEAGYPLRFGLMAAAVLVFRRGYKFESGRIGGLPIAAGAAVSVFWLSFVSTGSPKTIADILGPMGQGWYLLWAVLRIGGTVVLVPLIEEMFFRGYLLHRLDFGGAKGKAIALVLSSVAFGALHADVWLATVSGFVFELAALYKGRVSDAIAAHATANAGIAFWAVWTGDWSVIG